KVAVRSISDVATCATTSAFLAHRRLRPDPSTPADLSPLTRSTRVPWSAGASPQASAFRTDKATHASSTRVSIWNGIVVGKAVGMLSVVRNLMPPYPTATPPSP